MNYLLLGQEEYFKHQFLQKIKRDIFKKDKIRLDLDSFTAGESEIHHILDALRTFPLLSKRRIIIIKRIERFSQKERDAILNYLKSPSASSVLALEGSAGGARDFLDELSKYTETLKCDKLKDTEIIPWIIKELKARNKKILPPYANLLKEHVGNDLLALTSEIEKISTFAGSSPEITEQHIVSVLSVNSHNTVFDLLDFILEGKADKALALLEHLLLRERPHQVLNLIAWQFRSLMRIKELGTKIPVYDIARILRLNRKFARRASEQSKRFTEISLAKNMDMIMHTDLAIKRDSIKPRYALESVLIRLCAGA